MSSRAASHADAAHVCRSRGAARRHAILHSRGVRRRSTILEHARIVLLGSDLVKIVLGADLVKIRKAGEPGIVTPWARPLRARDERR